MLGGTASFGIFHNIEVYNPGGGWDSPIPLPGDYSPHAYYPWTFLLPDSRLFIAGPHVPSLRFDWTAPAGPEAFTQVHGDRSTSSQIGTPVLLTLRPPDYAPRVVLAAGNTAATQQTSEWIDLSDPAPAWTDLAPLNEPRSQESTAVLLPDGRVFLGGGILGADGGPAELFDPLDVAAGWQRGPHMTHERIYHSSIILLADGSVLAGGDPKSGGITPHERFFPDYFTVPRPEIVGAPASVGYGVSMTINTPQAADISEVVLMRPGAVTHGFNMSQRAIECVITGGGAASVTIDAPPSGNMAPPGWYLLHILDGDRVPSEGRWLRLTP